MIYYILITAFTVSIDSFLCGFSLSFENGKKKYIVLIITLTVFLMCLTTNYFIKYFNPSTSEKTASLGGVILIFIGIYNLIKKDKPTEKQNGSLIKQSALTGFAVGLDGACANLSLSLMGLNDFYVPLIIAVMHGILISFGILLSKSFIGKKIEKLNFVPQTLLIILGLYKLSSLLI